MMSTRARVFAVAFGLSGAWVVPVAAHAAPDCPPDQPSGAYCANGSCRSFEVDQNGVRCVDSTLEPLLPPPPDVQFGIGFGAA